MKKSNCLNEEIRIVEQNENILKGDRLTKEMTENFDCINFYKFQSINSI